MHGKDTQLGPTLQNTHFPCKPKHFFAYMTRLNYICRLFAYIEKKKKNGRSIKEEIKQGSKRIGNL